VLARQQKGTSKLAQWLQALSEALSRRPAGFRVPALDGNPILWREWRHARAALGVQVFWALYTMGAAIATVIGARAYWAGPSVQPMLAGAAGWELGIGALALAIQASLVWSEEKSAGPKGTDLLLATPLSAATIVNGKWRGVYRFTVPVVAFPVISSLIVLGDAPRVPAFEPETFSALNALAMVALVLAESLLYGAAFVSLGILLATRCAKPNHALFWTIGLYVGIALVAPTVTEIMFLGANRPLAMGLAMVSPVGAPIAVIMTRYPGPYFGPAQFVFPYAAIWLVVAAGAAWVLYRSTIQQFDRRMERIPAAGRRSGFAVVPARLALESAQPALDRQ
jgi:ABC-type transport system involved in multi-copper enzyme maturation permease subunit